MCKSFCIDVYKRQDIVVLGFDTTLTYEKLRRACRFLAAGKEYIATHPDFTCPTADGFMPDTGSMTVSYTHLTECYQLMDKGWYTRDFERRSDDPSRNMVRVGDAVSEELQKAGIGVIHDTEIHDLSLIHIWLIITSISRGVTIIFSALSRSGCGIFSFPVIS